MEKRYLRRSEIAKELGVSVETVNQWIKEQGLRLVILGERNQFIDRKDLDAFMEGNKTI